MSRMMTQIDELRKMLLEAGIPFVNKTRKMDAKNRKLLKPEERYGEAESGGKIRSYTA